MSTPTESGTMKWLLTSSLLTLLSAGLFFACGNDGSKADDEECAGKRDCPCVFNDECKDGLVCIDGGCGDDPREATGGRSGMGGETSGDGDGTGAQMGMGGDRQDAPLLEMGEECFVPTDCESGYCITVSGDGVCTESCMNEECPEGWACVTVGGGEFARRWCQPSCSPEEETCNNRDDDCDGEIDEDFKTDGEYLQDENCGSCGNNCQSAIQNAESASCEVMADTPTCVPGPCLPGFYRPNGVNQCVPLPTNLCQSCASDADCLAPESQCLTVAEGMACGRSCADDSLYGTSCPQGYECTDLGGGAMQCTPSSGSCICNEENEGLERSCGVLTCTGLQICENNGGSYEFSACSADGLIPEVCDLVDNDCDGDVDEDFTDGGGRYIQDEHCGVCNNNCLVKWNPNVYNAVGFCDTNPSTPVCAIGQCQTVNEMGIDYEFVDANDDVNDGCECKRVLGNTMMDEPDDVFFDDMMNRIYPDTDAEYVDENCDNLDGVESEAIFVRSGNTGGTGTRANPYPTIAEAIAEFSLPASMKSYILVAGGDYSERVTLTAGVRIYGGYSVDFSSRNIVSFPSRLVPAAPSLGSGVVGTVEADGIAGVRTVLSGFEIHGSDFAATPATPGQAGDTSYAVYLLDSDDALELSNNRILGGTGARGASGLAGSAGFGRLSSAGSVLSGGNGTAEGSCQSGTCSGANVSGGTAGTNPSCTSANGISGGSTSCPQYDGPSCTQPDPTKDGVPGTSWTLDASSSGSCGSHVTEAGFPTAILTRTGGNGVPGDDGNSGTQGNGCGTSAGSFVGGAFVPGIASSGGNANHGDRGGSGASAGGIDQADAGEMPTGVGNYTGGPNYLLGATGGGAGAGGCGGTAGGAGGSGGASIAVLVTYTMTGGLSAPPTVIANLVNRGKGGAGGNGGFGGVGGLGGSGGNGGGSTYWAQAVAGNGGRGGQGGTGGGGGGGCGGASYGIVVADADGGWSYDYSADNSFLLSDATTTGGVAGQGGPTGTTNPSTDGSDGVSSNYYTP